ncbi:3'-5' ssDNA/RNA exonuclease TatD [Alteromonas sp. KUL42]|uniref:TatD family hydrolase n=1 Tax=Alteromonas sp. KUL42 TaxID=2480797 RepID=UPI00103675C2|nr:TatD family hydrolase [Alteromonas sp. KUL42]TAP35686.1 hydrolase TatD [Alteromonas sp. KUL42]GEA07179.1 3'-5' ssDNA/RNA exonuclease TatD [Alteromonas sp. KUL42]
MAWFDAGVNLLDSRFEIDEVVARATDAGVSKLCVITTHPSEWDAAIALYNKYPSQCCYTIGVHPHNAKDVTLDHYETIRQLARQPGCVAIGECGLDFNRNFSPQDVQLRVFEEQLKLAADLQLPVYLHERDAFEQQIALLGRYMPSLKGGIAHCFTGDSTQVKQYLSLGLYIGITGWVCDEKRGEALRDAVKQVPLDKIILETDAPYLFPKTLRPRKRNNEPAFLPHIANQLGEYLHVETDKLRNYSYANTCRLFSLERV